MARKVNYVLEADIKEFFDNVDHDWLMKFLEHDMTEYRKSSHAVYDIKYHAIRVTKYRYKILGNNISKRLRERIRQGCETRGITIVSGNIRKDHIYLLLSCPPNIAPSKVVQYLKGRSSRLLQEEFSDLKKRY
jgi:putative transposase